MGAALLRGAAGATATGLGHRWRYLLTGEGSDVVIVIIRHSRVGPSVGVFVSSSIPVGVLEVSKQRRGTRSLGYENLGFPFGRGMFFFQKRPALHRAAAALEDATHTMSRATSRDSSGSEDISQSGLCFWESSGFCGASWVREFQTSEHGVNARMVASSGFGSAAVFSVLELGGPRKFHIVDIRPRPCNFNLPSLFCALFTVSCGAKTLPAQPSKC